MTRPKKVNVQVIVPDDPDRDAKVPYELLAELKAAYHPHLEEAKIVLAWRYGWREDRDGHLILATARRASDLDNQLHGWDFIVELNSEAWHAAGFDRRQMSALLDHELSHCSVQIDDSGEPVEDERGRPVWRLRKHDVEEFSEVVSRHGLWRPDLERFAQAALAAQKAADEPKQRRRPLVEDEG